MIGKNMLTKDVGAQLWWWAKTRWPSTQALWWWAKNKLAKDVGTCLWEWAKTGIQSSILYSIIDKFPEDLSHSVLCQSSHYNWRTKAGSWKSLAEGEKRLSVFTPYRLYNDPWNSDVICNFKVRENFTFSMKCNKKIDFWKKHLKIAKWPTEEKVNVLFNIAIHFF
jgi:hypothetical protein